MKGKLHVIAGVLFVLALLYDFYLWGGLARTPQMGPLMIKSTQRELALAGVYLPIGMELVDMAGLRSSAAEFAQWQFSDSESRLLATPDAALDTLTSSLPFTVALGYYGAPVLLALFAFAWWRRPREVHVVRR